MNDKFCIALASLVLILAAMSRSDAADDMVFADFEGGDYVFTDKKPAEVLKDVKRELLVAKRLLHLPVKNGAAKRNVSVIVEGRVERAFDIKLADAAPDWWAFLDVSLWTGKTITVHVDKLREDSQGLSAIEQSDSPKAAADLYREPLRPDCPMMFTNT